MPKFFQEVPPVRFILNFSKYCGETPIIIQERKVKIIFLDKKSKKKTTKKTTLYYRNCIGQTIQNKIFSLKIKRKAKNVFPSDVKITIICAEGTFSLDEAQYMCII